MDCAGRTFKDEAAARERARIHGTKAHEVVESKMSRIELHDLPARMRMLAIELDQVGAAMAYFGGFGAFGEYGAFLTEQTAPMMRALADAIQRMQGGTA